MGTAAPTPVARAWAPPAIVCINNTGRACSFVSCDSIDKHADAGQLSDAPRARLQQVRQPLSQPRPRR